MYVDRLDAAVVVFLFLVGIGAYFFFWLPAPPLGSISDSNSKAMVSGAGSSKTNVRQMPSFMSVCINATQPDSCAGTQAFDASDKSACDLWNAPDACRYYYLAARLEKRAGSVSAADAYTDCFSIQSTNWRVVCLEEHAVKLNDPMLCQTIEFTPYRNGCLELVNAS